MTDSTSVGVMVQGPITGGARGFPQTSAVLDLEAAGYVEEEYFISGTASSYQVDGAWASDGVWPAVEDATAEYATRVLVRRPVDADAFNGTAVVEWMNVTTGVDSDVDFVFMGEEIVRSGYVWVGVTAQARGIDNATGGHFGGSAVGLKAWDPQRYGQLVHPGDAFAYDMFTQIGATVSTATDELLGGLEPEYVLAMGESQSAFRLLTYANAVHPLVGVYDAILIHSRGGTGAPINEAMAREDVPAPAIVRTDLDIPVFQVQSETDLYALGLDGDTLADFPSARQPDSDRVRTWEVAGTSHADAVFLNALYLQGKSQFDEFLELGPIVEIANGGDQAEVLRAALHALNEWVRDGTPPPTASPIEVANGAIVRDEHGNALGGVRKPAVDAPVAVHTGEGEIDLIGARLPFDAAKLTALYPTLDDYVRAVEQSARAGVQSGFLLQADADALIDEARSFPLGG